jgi:hypothetical protein
MSQRIYFGVGEVAQQMGVGPRMISDLLYARKISIERCPVVAGRRLIPSDYLAEIERVLRCQKEDANAEPASVGGPEPSVAPSMRCADDQEK